MGIQINGNTNNINAGIGSLSIEDLNELHIVGVATAANFKTGVSNLHNVGLTLSGGQLDVGSNIKIGSGGIITATSYRGDGSQLTGIAGGVTSDAQGNTVGGTNSGDSFSGTDAIRNTLYGFDTGTAITTADRTTAVGYHALKTVSTNNNNSAFGDSSLRETTGQRNNAFGNSAGIEVTSGVDNCFFGSESGAYCGSSTRNTGVGNDSLYRVGLGGEGNRNTGVGYKALYDVRAGDENTSLGYQAGDNINGSNNIVIGANADASSSSVSNEITLGDGNIDNLRVPGLSLEFAKDHTYGVSGGRKNWFDNGSFDCTYGGRKANVSMDYGNHHAYGWVTDRYQSRNANQWSRSTNVPAGKGFSYSTQYTGVGARLVQAVELPDYGDMGVFAPNSYWCVSIWSTASINQGGQAFSYDLGSTKTGISIVHPSSGGSYQTTGETASGTSTGTFTRYYMVFQMPSSIISGATAAYWTWSFTAAGYATGWQLERVPTSTSKPTPYEHVHPSVTIARCRRYAYRVYNSRHVSGWKRHDSGVNWECRHPVLPTHMPSGPNQSVDPYGVHMHTAGTFTNFQSVWQNPGVSSLSRYGFNPADGSFILNGQSGYSGTHVVIPSYEGFEYEVAHGFF